MSAHDSQIMFRLALAFFASVGIHGGVIFGKSVVMYFGFTPPVALLNGGGSSGMGGKPGEGGVATADASSAGFSLRRVLAKSEDGSDDNNPSAAEVQEAEINPVAVELTKPADEVAVTAPAVQEPAKTYLTERPAPAVVMPTIEPVKVEQTSTQPAEEATGPPKMARKTSTGVARTGVVSVDIAELKAAAGEGAGLQGGTNGAGAGNGGGGRPGTGQGGGHGGGIGNGVGNSPSFAAGNLKPVYPPEAERLRQQGRVLLRVLVTVEGTAKDVQLEKTSNFTSLDASAIAAVQRWRFIPARQFGKPVETTVLVPINFQLDQ